MQLAHFFAYLDPGTGSLIIQSLIGAAAGVAVFGRRTIISLKQKFKGTKSDQTTQNSKAVTPAEASKNPSTKSKDKSDDTSK